MFSAYIHLSLRTARCHVRLRVAVPASLLFALLPLGQTMADWLHRIGSSGTTLI